MNISIFGSGYVGLVSAACLAEVGNHVVCVDIDANRIARLNNGEVPIHEPGLDGLLERDIESGRLVFTTHIELAVRHGLFQFIAVGTPPEEDGSADLQHVLQVARSIGQ
ncbi:MAG: UDP-glucose 6-dehydrogenase, partial [Methylococcales bacterium]